MKTRNNGYLKRFIAACLVLALLLSLGAVPGTVANAAGNSFKKTKVSLASNVVNDKSLTMYVKDDVYYMTIEDLCRLTRSYMLAEGNEIYVMHGYWTAVFDTTHKTFYDRYQKVNVTLLEVSKNQYAVDAVLFLCYFKAMVTLQDDKLECTMPAFTAWEALDVDIENTLLDIYQFYGSEESVTFAAAECLLVDYLMGNWFNDEGRRNDAFMAALEVDVNKYETVKEYIEKNQTDIYEYMHSKNGTAVMDALKIVLPVTEKPADFLIKYYFNMQKEPVAGFLYNARHGGEVLVARQYEKQLQLILENQRKVVNASDALYSNNNIDYLLLFASVIMETTRQANYVKTSNNLIYNVIGQKNLDELGFSANGDPWVAAANEFTNAWDISETELWDQCVSAFTDKVFWEELVGTPISSAADISGLSWTFSLNLARFILKLIPWTSNWINSFEGQETAIYLSELQQLVSQVADKNYELLYAQRDNLELYQKYIETLQLYCRVSIAMYEGLQAMVTEHELGRRDYWMQTLQEKIDKLSISLYQLSTIQGDGAIYCLPMILESGPVVLWSDATWKPATGEENYSSYRVEPMLLMSPNLGANHLFTDDWVELAAVVERQTNVVIGNSYAGAPYSGVVNLTVDSAYYAGDVLSVRMSAISYASGQAHPWHGGAVSNILFSTGEEATLNDILEPGSSYPNLRAGWMKLMQGVNTLDLNQSEETIVDKAMQGQLGTWTLTPEGLEVGFAPYEISSYKSYSGTTVIPYEKLKGELKAEYIPVEQTEDQESPSLEMVKTVDDRYIEDGYKIWGNETGVALVFTGDASHVTIFAADKNDTSWSDSVLFYASSLTDAVIWLPPCESGVYRVQWASGDTVAFQLVQVP